LGEPPQSETAVKPPAAREPLGRVISVSGSQARVGLAGVRNMGAESRATVGKFLGVRCGRSLLIGMITEVFAQSPATVQDLGYHTVAHLDIMGEIKEGRTGSPRFSRGVGDYPSIGDPADLISSRALRLVYDLSGSDTINIGHLNLDNTIGAYVHIDEMVSKHFAVLGTTGVGKSSGVVLILQQILQVRPDLRIFLVDAHNEYGRCFGDSAHIVNPGNLKLPFWLFNFEEIVDVFFGGRPGIDEEVEILAEVIPLAKGSYTRIRSNDRLVVKRSDAKAAGFTVDTPVPYMLSDLISLIDERMGKLENRSTRMNYHKLIQRIETVRNDPRYAFMFENANVGGDTMSDVLSELFRMPPNGKPMTIMQLAGFPAEVVDAVVSVLCRMAFDFGLWSDGAVPLLFVCEEAHRYASADRSIGFGPTRRAISRIAKEGRKYGVFLGLVTQRPAELDPTVISQCSTLFVMRMANDRDQALVRSAVSDAAANLLSFVPSLGTREVFAFGEGVALPVRLTFSELPDNLLPKSEVLGSALGEDGAIGPDFIASVVERWRGAMMSQKLLGGLDFDTPVFERSPPMTPTPAAAHDSERLKLVKRPLSSLASTPAPARLPTAANPARLPQQR
jgi:DNA helicase HerA-like ATPase